jgi:hypothetical protein
MLYRLICIQVSIVISFIFINIHILVKLNWSASQKLLRDYIIYQQFLSWATDVNAIGLSGFGSSWSWLYGSWIYNYLCNQSISPLKLWVRIPLRRCVLETTSQIWQFCSYCATVVIPFVVHNWFGGRHRHNYMVVGFTTTCVINAYHH